MKINTLIIMSEQRISDCTSYSNVEFTPRVISSLFVPVFARARTVTFFVIFTSMVYPSDSLVVGFALFPCIWNMTYIFRLEYPSKQLKKGFQFNNNSYWPIEIVHVDLTWLASPEERLQWTGTILWWLMFFSLTLSLCDLQVHWQVSGCYSPGVFARREGDWESSIRGESSVAHLSWRSRYRVWSWWQQDGSPEFEQQRQNFALVPRHVAPGCGWTCRRGRASVWRHVFIPGSASSDTSTDLSVSTSVSQLRISFTIHLAVLWDTLLCREDC